MKTLSFFVLVFALSIPLWILGAVAQDFTKILPIKLPISALMAVCPLLAATILVYRERKMEGIKQLLKRAFDYKRISDKRWYFPIVLLMPAMAAVSYWYLKFMGEIQPEAEITIWSAVLFFGVFFVGAIGEEIGWSGYLIDPMQSRFGALSASLMIGFVWAIWHIVPYLQAHQTPVWIIWQCIGTVFLRVIMVWLFNNTGKSVFAMVLFHAMINISPYLLPNFGAHYDPVVFAISLGITALFIAIKSGLGSKKNQIKVYVILHPFLKTSLR